MISKVIQSKMASNVTTKLSSHPKDKSWLMASRTNVLTVYSHVILSAGPDLSSFIAFPIKTASYLLFYCRLV